MDMTGREMIKFQRRTSAARKKRGRKPAVLSGHAELQRKQICELAARLVQEDSIRDYQKAKHRACDVLGIRGDTFLPSNREIEQALIQRRRLFETGPSATGRESLLDTIKDILRILGLYHARLSGLLADGIVLSGMPIEIHAFCNATVLVQNELDWRGIPNWSAEKRYRFTNQTYSIVPLFICELDSNELEISVFGEKELHRLPVCPTNGRACKRIAPDQLEDVDFLERIYRPAIA